MLLCLLSQSYSFATTSNSLVTAQLDYPSATSFFFLPATSLCNQATRKNIYLFLIKTVNFLSKMRQKEDLGKKRSTKPKDRQQTAYAH